MNLIIGTDVSSTQNTSFILYAVPFHSYSSRCISNLLKNALRSIKSGTIATKSISESSKSTPSEKEPNDAKIPYFSLIFSLILILLFSFII